MNDHLHDNGASATPEELRPIEASLDRLGQAERDAAPFDLEDRIGASLDDALHPEPRTIPMRRHRPRRRVLPHALALAAAVAVVGVAWLALNPPAPHAGGPTEPEIALASLEQGVDDLLALDELLDELGGPDTALATEKADEIEGMRSSPWELIESLDTAMSEESI